MVEMQGDFDFAGRPTAGKAPKRSREENRNESEKGRWQLGQAHRPRGAGGVSRFQSRLVRGDVTEVLSEQHGNLKFDVVIADPPYNIGKDFGTTKDKMPLAEYLEWTDGWLRHCFRLLAANGVIYVYGFPEVLAHVAVRHNIEAQRWLAWHYTNKTVPSCLFWQRSHESILCLWHEGAPRPALEVDQLREPYTEGYVKGCAGKTRAATKGRFSRGGIKTTYTAHQNGALPRDVIRIPALAGGAGASERWFLCRDCGGVYPPGEKSAHEGHNILRHPTQKPQELSKRLIQSRINGSGGRALIPFAGSGAECVAAESLGVGWLGIEIDPDFYDLAAGWINHV